MISIIIPMYNSEKFIRECILSVLNQSYGDFELIIVDDGSEDDCYAICRKYLEKDQRINLIKKENGGVSSARYQGLQMAQGEYITFLDNDDILVPDFLKTTIELMDNETDIVVASAENVLSENIEFFIKEIYAEGTEVQVVDVFSGEQATEEIINFNKYKISKPLWGKLYRKEFLLNLHLECYKDKIPILFFEDVFALDIIFSNARRVKFTNQILYIQRAVFNSQSRDGRLSDFYFNQIDSYALLYEYIKQKPLPKAQMHCLDNYDKCLERIWYLIKRDKNKYPDDSQICEHIDRRYKEYYQRFCMLHVGIIRKINMWMFMHCRRIWEITAGRFYFNAVTNYKKAKAQRELSK